MGPQALFKIFMDKKKEEEKEKSPSDAPPPENPKDEETKPILGADPVTGVYDSSNYQHTILNMTKKDLLSNPALDACFALSLSKILATKTNFFQEIFTRDETRKLQEEFSDFLAESLLHHTQLSVTNFSQDKRSRTGNIYSEK